MVRRVLFHVPNFICPTSDPPNHVGGQRRARQRNPRPHSALRTTTTAPIIGAHQPIPCPGYTPHCGQPHPHPSLAHTHENPGRNHPAGRDLSTSGHRGHGDSTRSHDDAYCGTKVEYRTSSTPAYTDRLDLQYSTNNPPTTTQVRSTIRIADNPGCTHDWCTPTKFRGATPHCGQLRLQQQPVPTHEPRSWRSRKNSRRCFPTWTNSSRKRPARQRLRNPPRETPHCGQPQPDPSLAHAHECLARHSQRRYPTNRRVIDQSPRPNSPPPETEALELHEGVLGLLQELAFLAGAL